MDYLRALAAQPGRGVGGGHPLEQMLSREESRESAPDLAKFDVSSWFGVFLPKATPAPIVDALNMQIKAMLERDDIKKTIANMGARSDWGTPQQFADFVQAETVKFGEIIKREGLQMDVN